MEIITYYHPILRCSCKTLKKVDNNLLKIFDEARELMNFHGGVGISAPQVGYPFKWFIIKDNDVIINPVVHFYGKKISAIEKCLSLPELNVIVERQEKVRLSGYNSKGVYINWNVKGILARIIAHEFDHLNGNLIIDTEIKNIDKPFKIKEFQDSFESSNFNTDEYQNRMKELEEQYC